MNKTPNIPNKLNTTKKVVIKEQEDIMWAEYQEERRIRLCQENKQVEDMAHLKGLYNHCYGFGMIIKDKNVRNRCR